MKSNFLLGILVFIMLIGLGAGLIFFNTSQDIRSRATNTGTTLALSPTTASGIVGQTVTVNFWLAVPLFIEQDATGLTVKVTTPAGTTSSLGTFTTDTTGGTFTTYTPTTVGNYTFQMF